MEQVIFRSKSNVDGAPGYRERTGQPVTVVDEVHEDEAAHDPDEEVATIYRVRFQDGVETEAFADELEPLDSEAS